MIFRIFKPRCIFVSDYYGHLSAVKAANDLGIAVVEIQHGFIGIEHPAYNVYTELDRSYFPSHMLVFGKRDLKTFHNSRFIDPTHVHPVGNYYIDYIKKNYRPEPAISRWISSYHRSVGITLQVGMEKRLIEFVCQAASLDDTICHIIIPRVYDNYFSNFSLPTNVIISKNRGFYEFIMHVDFHSTVNSTCAIEAPSLGVQNILINIDNEAKRYYENVLDNRRITKIVDTPQQYVDTINSFEKLDKDTVCSLNEDSIASNYNANIKRFIETFNKSLT